MRILKIICVTVSLLMLVGCGKVDSSALSYADHAFCAHIKGQMDGLEFVARIQAGTPSETGTPPESGTRDICVEFLSPESLEGIVVTKDATGTHINLDGVAISDAAAQGWLRAAQVLIPSGRVVSIKKTDGEAATATVTLDSKQTIVVDLNTGAPLECTVDGIQIKVTRFEYAE